MALNTGGFPLSTLPSAPAIPDNIGKVDVPGIYDNVVNALKTHEAIASSATRQAAVNSQNIFANQKAQSETALLSPEANARVAQAQALAAQAPLHTSILSSQADLAQQTTPGAIAATNAQNADAKLQSDLKAVFARSGLQYGAEQADAINQGRSNLLKKISAAPGGVSIEPITGPNGTPLGSMVGYMGPNGPEMHAMPVPSLLARQTAGFGPAQYIGPGDVDPATGNPLTDQYQYVEMNSFGGVVGKPIIMKVPHGAPPPLAPTMPGQPSAAAPSATPAAVPGAAPAAGTPGPTALPGASVAGTTLPGGRLGAGAMVKMAEERNKERMDALSAIGSNRDQLTQNAHAIGALTAHIQEQQASTLGSGMISGMLSGTPLATAAGKVKADLSNFVGGVMASAKNIRTQREFNAFTGAVPSESDQPEVQNAKLKYISEANTVLTARNDEKERLLRSIPTLDADQASQIADEKYPFPIPAGGWTTKPDGTPLAPAAAAPAAPSVDALLNKYK